MLATGGNVGLVEGIIKDTCLGFTGGGVYPYRLCKAAQNAMTRNMSEEFLNIPVRTIAIYPGWVKTDLGGPKAPLTADESINGILQLLDDFDEKKHNGNFFDYKGNPLPW